MENVLTAWHISWGPALRSGHHCVELYVRKIVCICFSYMFVFSSKEVSYFRQKLGISCENHLVMFCFGWASWGMAWRRKTIEVVIGEEILENTEEEKRADCHQIVVFSIRFEKHSGNGKRDKSDVNPLCWRRENVYLAEWVLPMICTLFHWDVSLWLEMQIHLSLMSSEITLQKVSSIVIDLCGYDKSQERAKTFLLSKK